MSLLTDAAWLMRIFRALEIALVLGCIILVHEFGHFVLAKWSRMRVDEFGIGIGPTIKSWRRGGTLYRLSPFLFMGYVKIRGLEGEENADDLEGSFYTRPYGQRLLVITGGALANVVIAALLFCLLYGTWGVPDVHVDTMVAAIIPNSAAEEAGIEPGWRITAVDDQPTPTQKDVQRLIGEAEGTPVTLRLERPDEVWEVTLRPRLAEEPPPTPLARLGLFFTRLYRGWDYRPKRRLLVGVGFRDDAASTNVIDRVQTGGPADIAGLRRGDRIVAIDGRRTEHPVEILEALSYVPPELELDSPENVGLKPLAVTFVRDGVERETTILPVPRRRQREKPLEAGEEHGPEVDRPLQDFLVADCGLALQRRYKRLGVVGAVRRGFRRGIDVIDTVLEGLGFLAKGRKLDQLGGPVAILRVLSDAAFFGLYDLIEMAATLSIMIGLFQLLPIPALDGGRVVFILLEWLFRRPVLNRTKESWVHAVGLVVLLGLVLLVSIRDLRRW